MYTTTKGQMLTASQVGRCLDVSREWVRILAKRGELPYEETPLGWLYRSEDVERLRHEREIRKLAHLRDG